MPPPAYGPPPTWPQHTPPPQQGQPYGYAYGYPQPPNTNGFCIAALVCALLGIVLWFIGPVLGVIFGWVGLRQTARLGERGRGLAIAGIVVGAVVLVVNIALVVSLVAIGTDPITTTGVTV